MGELLDRALPSEPLAEQMWLRQIILTPDVLDSEDVTAEHFHSQQNRKVYAAIGTLRENCKPIDFRNIVSELTDSGSLEAVGGLDGLRELIVGEPLPANAKHYLAALRDAFTKRRLFFTGTELIKAAHSKAPAADLLTDFSSEFDRLNRASTPSTLTYRTLTPAELDAGADELEYAVADTMVAGQPLIVAGPPKSLKTSLATDLALSLATGTEFLGVYGVPRARRVVVMSGESGEAASRVCYRSVAAAKGYDLARVPGLFWSDQVPRIGSLEHLDAMRGHLGKYQPEVLVIDPAYRALAGCKPEDLFQMGDLLGTINDLCRAHGCTLVLVHHSRKNNTAPFAPTTLDDLAWAGFREFFRQWILVSRRQAYEPGSGVHELRLDVGGSARHSWCAAVTVDEGPFREPRWSVSVRGIVEAKDAEMDAAEARKDHQAAERRARDRKKLIDAAAHFPEGETLNLIREYAGLGGTVARQALAEALQLGELIRCELRKNGKPFDGFKLAVGQSD